MKFALAAHGTRGDIEPCAAVGRELLHRGHEVRMAVPPNLVGFVESAGLAAVAYGPDSQKQLEEDFVRKFWKIQNPIALVRAGTEYLTQGWAEMSRTLTSLADGADLILTGALYQAVAANVAEYYDIPLAALHCFPLRANGRLFPILPPPLVRSGISVIWWLHWRMTQRAEDAQRRELDLAKAIGPSARRIVESGSLEIQAYDELCFPGLAAEWSEWDGRRPFVGALTMELPTDADNEVASWIAAGTPPIAFCFGSIPVESPADTVDMISAACAAVRRTSVDLLRSKRFQPRTTVRPRKSRGPSELCGHLSRLPRSRPPRWRGHHSHRHAGRYPHVDPLGWDRSADLGSYGPTAQSRLRSALFDHHTRFARGTAPVYPHDRVRHPSPRDRRPG